MNKKHLTLIISLVAIILLIVFYTSKEKVVQQNSIPIFVKVAPYVGLSVDKDKLHFGTVPRGGSSKRMLFLNNQDVYEKIVIADIGGSVRQFVTLSDNNFKLARDENKTLYVTISVPKDAEYGNYSGNLVLYFKKA